MFFKKIKVVTGGADEKAKETLLFASRELQSYLRKSCNGDFPIITVDSISSKDADTMYIGIKLTDELPKVEKERFDDAILIDIKDYAGIITGVNARATLIAVYRFLKEVGFYFLNPGPDGDVIPEIKDDKCKVKICEVPDNRYRIEVSEGTIYQENLFDVINWLPKVGMNGYFMQFFIPKVFIDRYYEVLYGVKLTNEEMRSMIEQVEVEIRKRSLIYVTVGHGWTCDPFGIQCYDWKPYEGPEPTEEQRNTMALINGKRGFAYNNPICTNLCYSNPDVRKIIIDYFMKYCAEHPDVDVVYFSLADGANTMCECDECRKLRASDYYVMIMNEIDEKLTEAGLDTQIVFNLYVDLLWPPVKEKIKNPDRFIMSFAPITRSYTEPMTVDKVGKMREYDLNKNIMPVSVEENLAYLKGWQENFDGDALVYDYHYMWDHYRDFSYMGTANIIHRDIKNYEKLGLKGLMNCQLQRVFLPSSIGMHSSAQTLWNKKVDFDDIVNEVFEKEFGTNYKQVVDYLYKLFEYGCSPAVRGEEYIKSPENVEKLNKALEIIAEFKPIIEREIASLNEGLNKYYWEALLFHSKMYTAFIKYYLALETDDEKDAHAYVLEVAAEARYKFKDVFDAVGIPKIVRQELMEQLKVSLAIGRGEDGPQTITLGF